MAKWTSFLALLGCSAAKEKAVQPDAEPLATTGSLEIHCTIERTASGAWYNQGGKPGHKDVTSYFSVKYRGKMVVVPTSQGAVTHFWQALVLTDAPIPTVLVGTHSMYLITEENGQLTVKPVDEQGGDFAKYQWLDSENGQPGQQHKVYLGDDSKSSRFLAGGRYLLVNTRTLLDVQSLTTYPIDNNSSELVDHLEGFNAFQSEVVGFSPRKTQLVLIGYRRNLQTNHSEYALVAIDFASKHRTAERVYAVPFDRTDTRFFSIWDATQPWVATYFDWSTDQDGKERLRLQQFRQRPYWTGRWSLDQSTGQPKEYQLRPVLPGMIAHFMDCVRKQYAITDLQTRESGEMIITEFNISGTKFTLYYYSRDKTLTLNCEDKLLIKSIGENVDKELAKGKFQDAFGKYDFD